MANILICDDEKDIVNALTLYLSRPDTRIFPAYNGREALDILSAEDIHLVFLDIMMPEMDGITCLGRIRERSNVPVILLTAKSMAELQGGDLRLSIDGDLFKAILSFPVIADETGE